MARLWEKLKIEVPTICDLNISSMVFSRLLAIITNIRLDWKSFAGANTLAYYINSQITDIKGFITLAPDKRYLCWLAVGG